LTFDDEEVDEQATEEVTCCEDVTISEIDVAGNEGSEES
jgi:hypothetical protein